MGTEIFNNMKLYNAKKYYAHYFVLIEIVVSMVSEKGNLSLIHSVY